jgi:outer membrane protein assembly factor BamD (BamD/ComL family)
MNNPGSSSTPKLEKVLTQWVSWIRTHQEQFWAISGSLVAAIVIVVFMVRRHQEQNDQAWTQLGMVQGYLMQNQYEPARKALDQWSTSYKGTSAETYAKFLRADLLYGTSQYAESAQVYGEIAQTAPPELVRPLALAAQAAAQEQAGQLPQAQASVQQFLDKYPDHFLAASMYLSQARLAELTGNPAGASAIYDRFVILYPQSPWTQFVHYRLQHLTPGSTPSPVKK